MNNEYPICQEREQGFNIQMSFQNEVDNPCEVYDTSNPDDLRIIDSIINNEYNWVAVTVSAFKKGVKLAEEHLGCCVLAENDMIEDFKSTGYYEDMRREVIEEAKKVIKTLCEE